MSKMIIEEIFANGKNICTEEITSEKYIAEYNKYSENYEKLIKNLSAEDKKLLVEIDGCLTQIDALACTEKFIQGFKARFRFAAELLKN